VRPLSQASAGRYLPLTSTAFEIDNDEEDDERTRDEENEQIEQANPSPADEDDTVDQHGEQARDSRDVVPDPPPAISRLRRKHAAQRELLREYGSEEDAGLLRDNLEVLCETSHDELMVLAFAHLQNCKAKLPTNVTKRRAALREFFHEEGRAVPGRWGGSSAKTFSVGIPLGRRPIAAPAAPRRDAVC
jgi:hypothetical protein